jgi:hypothetical protein
VNNWSVLKPERRRKITRLWTYVRSAGVAAAEIAATGAATGLAGAFGGRAGIAAAVTAFHEFGRGDGFGDLATTTVTGPAATATAVIAAGALPAV